MDVENANCKLKVSQCTDIEVLPIEKPLKINKDIEGLEKLIEELYRVFSSNYVNVHDVQALMTGYHSDPKHWKKYAKFDRFRYTRNLVDAGNGAFNIMILCWAPGQASAIHDHADSHCFMKVLSGCLEEVRYDWPDNDEVQPELVKKLKNREPKRHRCCSGGVDTSFENDSCQNNCQNGTLQNDSCQNRGWENGNCQNSNPENGNAQNGGSMNEDLKNVNFKDGEFANGGLKNGEFQNGDGYHNEDSYDARNMCEISRKRLEIDEVCYINDALGLHRMENPSNCDGAVSLHLYCPPFDSCRVFDARTGRPTEVKVTFWSMYGKRMDKIADKNVPATENN